MRGCAPNCCPAPSSSTPARRGTALSFRGLMFWYWHFVVKPGSTRVLETTGAAANFADAPCSFRTLLARSTLSARSIRVAFCLPNGRASTEQIASALRRTRRQFYRHVCEYFTLGAVFVYPGRSLVRQCVWAVPDASGCPADSERNAK